MEEQRQWEFKILRYNYFSKTKNSKFSDDSKLYLYGKKSKRTNEAYFGLKYIQIAN